MPTINGENLSGNGGSPLEQPKSAAAQPAGFKPVWNDRPQKAPAPRVVRAPQTLR